MSHPRISVFARLANGNATPVRTIAGQATLQARTAHDIGVDPIHDEIVVPNPFAQAILVFRGDANGEEKPLRVIQGPKTLLGYSDTVAVDPVHNEIFAPQFRTDSILVFAREANGDVAPIRIIHGPKTRLDRPDRLDVDPVNNLLAVATQQGLWVFDRTASGDVPPRYVIAGPKSGVGGKASGLSPGSGIALDPRGKKIFQAGGEGHGKGVIRIWKYGDNGDVPPWALLRGPHTKLGPSTKGVAIDPENKELVVLSAGSVLVFHLPEVF